jgi:hypothetical protein
MDVPDNLIGRRKSRIEASESVSAAKAACKALSDELSATKSDPARAERSANEAALSVVIEEAGRISPRLDAAKREAWQLAYQLRGLSELWLPTGLDQAPRPIRLAQRGIGLQDAELIVQIGTEVEGGYLVLVKDYQEVERQVKEFLARCRLVVGKRLIVADGQIVTAYHASRKHHRRLLRNAHESDLCE